MTSTAASDRTIYMGNCIERALMAVPLNKRKQFARSLAEIIVTTADGDGAKIGAAYQSLIHLMEEAESKEDARKSFG